MLAPRDKLWSTPQPVLAAALGTLGLTPADVLVDMGCGDGRAVMTAAEVYGCRAVGFEIHGPRAAAAAAEVARRGLDTWVTIVTGNALEVDLPADTSAVYLYLIERGLKAVWPRLHALARPLRVVTVLYSVPGVAPTARHTVTFTGPSGVPMKTPLYVYHIHGGARGGSGTDAGLGDSDSGGVHVTPDRAVDGSSHDGGGGAGGAGASSGGGTHADADAGAGAAR